MPELAKKHLNNLIGVTMIEPKENRWARPLSIFIIVLSLMPLILLAMMFYTSYHYGMEFERLGSGYVVMNVAKFAPELGWDTGESVERLQNCDGAYFIPARHTTTTFGAGNNPETDGYVYILAWEKLYVNKDADRKFDSQTVIIQKGALNYLTTNKIYHCTNRRFHDVYGIPNGLLDHHEMIMFVASKLESSSYCPPNWDCTLPIKYAFVEDNHITETGEFNLNK